MVGVADTLRAGLAFTRTNGLLRVAYEGPKDNELRVFRAANFSDKDYALGDGTVVPPHDYRVQSLAGFSDAVDPAAFGFAPDAAPVRRITVDGKTAVHDRGTCTVE